MRWSVLIAAVMAIGDAAPTQTENRIIGPTTVTTVTLPIAATTKNGAAPASAIALVARNSKNRPADVAVLKLRKAGMPDE